MVVSFFIAMLVPRRRTATPQHHAGLTLAQLAEAKALPAEHLRMLGCGDLGYQGRPAVRIPYVDEYGAEIALRYRVALDGDDKFRWRAGARAKGKLYGLGRLRDAREAGYVVLVEGESDAWTLSWHGFPVVALPGAGMWDEANSSLFADVATVYVLVEPDRGGETMLSWLGSSSLRDRAQLVQLTGAKDPSELHIDDPTLFAERFELALQQATPWAERERIVGELRRREAWASCGPLASEPDLLDRFADELARAGFVGETKAAKILYLALTSRLLDRPVSVAVKGPSSAGKSYLVERVLGFFPACAYHALTAMSERALAYSTEPLHHRFLILYEAAGIEGEFASYLVRSLLSEGRIRYETVEKTANGLEPRLIERPGPTGLVVTTTRVQLHPENETRLFSLTVTDTPEQTRAIFQALAAEDAPAADLTPWLQLQAWLEGSDNRVTIPYATALADAMPPLAVRLRRDFGALLNLIRTHAILCQARRDRDPEGRIIATLADYTAVRELVLDLIADGVDSTVTDTLRQTVETVVALTTTQTDVERGVSITALARQLKIDKSSAQRRVQVGITRGYLTNLEDRRGKPARIIPGEPLPEHTDILPDPAALADRCTVAAANEGTAASHPNGSMCVLCLKQPANGRAEIGGINASLCTDCIERHGLEDHP